MLFVILLLFCARFVNSQYKPTISWSSPDQLANVNDVVNLQCAVQQGRTKSPLSWYKINKGELVNIALNDQLFIPQDPQNAKFGAYIEGEKYILRIHNISEDDAGEYKCTLTLSINEQVNKQIRITVRTPPSILENTTSPVTTRVNSSTKLECYVSGTPPPMVIWTRENNGLLPNGDETFKGSVLRIDRVRKEDAGTYYCTAQNDVGSGVRKTYKLQVEFEPVIEVPRKRVGQALKNQAELECRVSAFPDPEIVWTMNSTMVPNWERNVQITKATQPNAVTVTKLIITANSPSMYGAYTCKAKNALGETQETIEFHETAEVQCVSTCGSGIELADLNLILSAVCVWVFALHW